MKKIDCFIPFAGKEQAEKTVQGLQATGLIGNIRLVTTDPMLEPLPGCEILSVDMPYSSTAMKTIAEKTDAEYTLLYTKETTLELDSRRQADECSCHRLSVRLAERRFQFRLGTPFQYFKAKRGSLPHEVRL